MSPGPEALETATQQPVEGEAGQLLPPPEVTPTLLSETLASGLMVVGVLGLVFILFRNLRRQKQKQFEFDRPPKERIENIRSEASGANDLHGMTARAQETVQTLITQLENKATRLERLLDRAESKIAEFEDRLDRNQPAIRGDSATAPGASDASSSPSLPIDPLHRRVHALADQGLSPVDIARQVDRPTGQVELILALRRA